MKPNIKNSIPLGLGCSYAINYKGACLKVIASTELNGWDHVSVSLLDRCPTWDEMCYIKNLFWEEDEMTIQFHPRKKDYVNMHPYCLHMWKVTEPTYTRLLEGI